MRGIAIDMVKCLNWIYSKKSSKISRGIKYVNRQNLQLHNWSVWYFWRRVDQPVESSNTNPVIEEYTLSFVSSFQNIVVIPKLKNKGISEAKTIHCLLKEFGISSHGKIFTILKARYPEVARPIKSGDVKKILGQKNFNKLRRVSIQMGFVAWINFFWFNKVLEM